MNKLKLLPLIAPTAVAVIAPTISCASGKITGDWTEFNYDKEKYGGPSYLSNDSISVKANKKYTASFKITAPKDDLKSCNKLCVQLYQGTNWIRWTETVSFEMWLGKDKQTADINDGAIECEWNNANLGKLLKFSFVDWQDMEDVRLIFIFG